MLFCTFLVTKDFSNDIYILDRVRSKAMQVHVYNILVKSNQWSVINAAFWLVELLLGYTL